MTVEEEELLADAEARARRTRLIIAVGSAIGGALFVLLLVLGWIVITDKDEQADAGNELADKVLADPGCETGDIPDAACDQAREVKQVAKDGAPGLPGQPGEDGEDGRDGKDGDPGRPGKNGRDGRDGKDGSPGADSTVPGPAGADSVVPGPPGVDGKDGQDGKDGEPGRSAYPFRFTFTVPTNNPADPERTYLVRCVDPDSPCEVTIQQQQTPDEEPTAGGEG